MNFDNVIAYLQFGTNAFAIGVAGWIYSAYIKNLKSALSSKDEQLKTIEKNLTLWKDQVQLLEKKTPEYVEELLNKRIKVREEEIARLAGDKDSHTKELELKNQELLRLKSELEKAKDVRRHRGLMELELDDEYEINVDKLEIEEMGVVAVDSGQLMITDPCYIDSEWKKEEFEDERLLQDVKSKNIYQFRKDFANYGEKIAGYSQTVNELISSGELVELKIEHDSNFSYSGACHATLSEKGYGQMKFELGHEGAGIAVRTVHGDGIYPVFAEKYDGRVVRIYVNLL